MSAVGFARTAALVGLDVRGVAVEAHVGAGLPGFHIIGASGATAREAADRVRTALHAVDVALPARKTLVSLAPADVPKSGARYDLAVAAAVLSQLGKLPEGALAGTALLGELSLDGNVRAVPGVLPSAAWLAAQGVRRLVVPDHNAGEAALAASRIDVSPKMRVLPVESLREALAVLSGHPPRPIVQAPRAVHQPDGDLADVRGQHEARRALEIAAAGGHHLLLVGPPGCGKSMLAGRLTGILPPLSDDKALELAAVRSVAGMLEGGPVLDRTPPFRAPHHTASRPALLGGGSGVARPGELSLATGGVLFMDELFEWPRRTLDALREPLAERVVRVARAHATVVYPADVQLAAAANPCPCARQDGCVCSDREAAAYRSRLSGPLADRLDLAPAVSPLRSADLLGSGAGESTAVVAVRVAAARDAAAARWAGGATSNADAPIAALRATVEARAAGALAAAVDAGVVTGRGYDRALRVARTIADLAGAESIGREHALEALGHRMALAQTEAQAAS